MEYLLRERELKLNETTFLNDPIGVSIIDIPNTDFYKIVWLEPVKRD